MATYIKIAGYAEAEAFDGSQASAEALVAAYPDEISIQQEALDYAPLIGANSYSDTPDSAEDETTGVTLVITNKEAVIYEEPAVVTIDVTAGATASGVISIIIRGEKPVTLKVTAEDTAAEIAAAIALLDFGANWSVAIDGENLITLTQKDGLTRDAILVVKDRYGVQGLQNAYAGDYIAWVSGLDTEPETRIFTATVFEKYFTLEVT